MKVNTLIIAEAGINHNGDLDLAREMIRSATESGADMVKFQSFITASLTTKKANNASYQERNTEKGETQYDMLEKVELSSDDLHSLKDFCDESGIAFLASVFSEDAAEQVEDIVDLWKIPSGEITNIPFLAYLAKRSKPILLSTGMADLSEIRNAIDEIRKYWKDQSPSGIIINGNKIEPLTLLHCVSDYPASPESMNLHTMRTLEAEFNLPVGLSDHSLGVEVSYAAVSLGAMVIEKHFTLDKTMPGPDHAASLDPTELLTLVKGIRNIELALGDGEKKILTSEEATKLVARKSIHLKTNMSGGSVINQQDLIMKRPGDGIQPGDLKRIVGKKLTRDLEADHQLAWEDIE
ncbi:MAG: N-acetylneuraminate synthase [Bacteroidetes bacterium]|nr:N-acetylneuraminate synthase [Bacteroidota bacterium]